MNLAHHVHYQRCYDSLKEYLKENSDEEQNLGKFACWLLQRFEEFPNSLEEYLSLEREAYDIEDMRYPADDFLISLYESTMKFTSDDYDRLIALLNDIWYRDNEDGFIVENHCVTADTLGWSGNEDIITTLIESVIGRVYLTIERDSEMRTVYHISYNLPRKHADTKTCNYDDESDYNICELTGYPAEEGDAK